MPAVLNDALTCLETRIKGQELQYWGLLVLVGMLQQCTCLETKEFDKAAERAVLFGSRLATKKSQSRALCLCSSLFWCPACQDPNRSLLCLRRALILTDAAIQIHPNDVGLFIDVLDTGIQLLRQGNEEVTGPFLTGLLQFCIQQLRYAETRSAGEPEEARIALRGAIAHLQLVTSEQEGLLTAHGCYAKIWLEELVRSRKPAVLAG